jgi:RNA polymerase sigma-70 factor (TIGR02960 family)
MTEATLTRARGGDEAAFAALTEPYRRELQVHCYRMLGSLHDAEDAVQETLVAAWRGLEGYAERASLRTWLYRIATNRCLNAIRDGARRPPAAALPFAPPQATRMSEVSWLEPYPDALLEGLPDGAPGPDARYETREAVGLALISGLARLPARQRAALVLRDVLGYRAAEVAELLETSEATVNSALQRARAGLAGREGPARERALAPGSRREREVAETFADAFERGETDRVVELLTDDAWVKMPPEPYEYQGRAAIADFLRHASLNARPGRITRLLPTRANGGPAFAHYTQEAGEALATLSGLFVLQFEGERIAELTRFGLSNLPSQFELEPTVPCGRLEP